VKPQSNLIPTDSFTSAKLSETSLPRVIINYSTRGRGHFVPTPPAGNNLSGKRNATLILRLVLDQHGRLMHGELIDVVGGLPNRFVAWRGLIRTVRAWLTRQVQAGASDNPQKPA
jgi:hypothetical protein